MLNFKVIFCGVCVAASLTANADISRVKASIERVESANKKHESLVLPYLFSTDTMGLNFGVGGMIKGYHQPQMTVGATAFKGDVSEGAWAGLFNYKVLDSERWYFSASGMAAYFPDQRAYTGGHKVPIADNAVFPGSNDSSNEVYLEADGSSNWFDARIEYALPFGATSQTGMVRYQLKNGLLVSEPSGGAQWNPLESGVMVATARYFRRSQSFEFNEGTQDGSISAMEFGLLYDNTDFATNPSYGSRQYLAYSQSMPGSDDIYDWDLWQFNGSKFISLGASEFAHQRILAFNFWAAYSPSWQVNHTLDGTKFISDAAPYNEGATLGGFKRLRGYDFYRFHDKAAIYGAFEYRYTLKYNPIADINWLKFLKLDWFQLVGFVEAGRVSPHLTFDALWQDYHYDYGVSLRAMMSGLVVRTELANSKEGANFWVMIDQPF